MTTDLPVLTTEENIFADEQAEDRLTPADSLRSSFYEGFRAAKMWYSETERDASNNWGPTADPEAWVRIKTSDLTDLRREVNTLRHEAQRDKDDATKANALLVQAEKKLAEMEKAINDRMPIRNDLRAAGERAARAYFDKVSSKSNDAIFDEDFRTEGEQQTFTVAYETARALSMSIMDTAKVAWLNARAYFELAKTEAEGSKPVATVAPRSDAELRNLAAQSAASGWFPGRDYTAMFNDSLAFLQDREDPIREQALFMSKSNIGLAKEIYRSLHNEDQTSDFTD